MNGFPGSTVVQAESDDAVEIFTIFVVAVKIKFDTGELAEIHDRGLEAGGLAGTGRIAGAVNGCKATATGGFVAALAWVIESPNLTVGEVVDNFPVFGEGAVVKAGTGAV